MRDGKAELVRIDKSGAGAPHWGDCQPAPARPAQARTACCRRPAHVVFMRYTGEDGRRDAEDGAIVRLAGEVTAPGALCDILALLGQTGWRASLVVLDGDDMRSVFFDQGNVVGALTNVEEERLGVACCIATA